MMVLDVSPTDIGEPFVGSRQQRKRDTMTIVVVVVVV
jgi:hypothetical protein